VAGSTMHKLCDISVWRLLQNGQNTTEMDAAATLYAGRRTLFSHCNSRGKSLEHSAATIGVKALPR